jgi:hypothetical protein
MRSILLTALLVIGLIPVQALAATLCANVYIYNGTISAGHSSPADMFAKNSIEEQIKTRDGLCFKGYVDSGSEWQVQTHQKNDMLLSYTVGTLDDGNGVGQVGKTIEVITYDVYSWDGKLNHIVNSGPDLAWFAVRRDAVRLQAWSPHSRTRPTYRQKTSLLSFPPPAVRLDLSKGSASRGRNY